MVGKAKPRDDKKPPAETTHHPPELRPLRKSPWPPKSIERLVDEYVRDWDLPKALSRAGYVEYETVTQINEQARRVEKTDRFRSALQAAVRQLELATYTAVAREGKGTASLQAAQKLREAVDKMVREPVDKSGPAGGWGKKHNKSSG